MKKKQSSTLKSTKDLAFASLLSALCFVMMYLGTVTDVLDLCAVVLCSMVIVISIIEIGKAYPYMIWLSCGILCILLLPRIDYALEFILFGGIYPMLKALFEKLPKIASYAAKLAFFNIIFTGWFFLSAYLVTGGAGFRLGIIPYAAANVFFILTDLALSVMAFNYITKIRPRLKMGKR